MKCGIRLRAFKQGAHSADPISWPHWGNKSLYEYWYTAPFASGTYGYDRDGDGISWNSPNPDAFGQAAKWVLPGVLLDWFDVCHCHETEQLIEVDASILPVLDAWIRFFEVWEPQVEKDYL